MARRFTQPHRPGAIVVEGAFVLPVMGFLIFATMIGGYGVFRYQQLAMLAREGARYASVHGGQYQQETGNPAATQSDVYNNAIVPLATGLDLAKLSCSVTWNSSNMPYSVNSDYEKPTSNTVTVTVSYQWFPEAYLAGPITMSSTSTMPMSY